MRNQPYVKQYDDNGVLTNPIKGVYKSGLGRKYRSPREPRKMNNRKTFHTALFGLARFHIRIQSVLNDDGTITRILHYQPANKKAQKSLK